MWISENGTEAPAHPQADKYVRGSPMCLSGLCRSLYPGYRTSKGSRAAMAVSSSWLEPSCNGGENRPGRDCGYTCPLRIGDRKNQES